MTTPIIAVKCYGYAWMTEYGLGEDAAADRLREHGVDWALLQNRMDPLPSSGVEQLPPADAYDDRRFRDRVRERGIAYYESTAVFFQPHINAARPDLRPVSDRGDEMTMFDWYLGVSPHSRDYLEERADLMGQVVSDLEPDGVFLSFVRFPGFWEGWTPAVERGDIRDYGFSRGALERFSADTGIALPAGDVPEIARVVLGELRAEWTAWKVGVIAGVVERLRDAARAARPGTEVLINGLAFAADERGDLGVDVTGQDLGVLSTVAEHIETMVYHQILARPAAPWIADTVRALRSEVRGTLLGSVQTSPAYTEPPHDGLGRTPHWTPDDFADALRGLADGGADGVSVYHWTDLVADEERADGQMVRALRDYKAGDLR